MLTSWLINTVLGCLAAVRYLKAPGVPPHEGWTSALTLLILISHIATLTLLVTFVMRLITQPRLLRPLREAFLAIGYTALLSYLYVDAELFKLFRFHINGLVWNVITTPGGLESLGLSSKQVWGYATILVSGLLMQFGLVVWTRRLRPPRTGRTALLTTVAVLALSVTEKSLYGLADFYGARTITVMSTVFPLYYPLTFRRALGDAGFDPDAAPFDEAIARSGALNTMTYPLHPLQFASAAATAPRPNIVWIVLDSWRTATVNEENAPAISSLAANELDFTRHFSGGNATRTGIFSLFYGLHGFYWHKVLTEQRGPVFLTELARLGYDVELMAGASMTFPEFRRTAFVDFAPSVADHYVGSAPWQKDQAMVSDFISRKRVSKPFFSFIFFDSTHAPYSFPPAIALYKPFSDNFYAEITDTAELELVERRYQNAVAFADSQVSRVVDHLKATGQWDNTILVVTGDHGEEFYEYGYWGHVSQFDSAQVEVPFIVHWPGRGHERIDRWTSHADLTVTLLEHLGVENTPSDYSHGRSLFATEARPYVVSCGWDQCASITASGTLVFGTAWYNAGQIVRRDAKYHEMKTGRLPQETQRITGLMREFSKF